MKKRVIAIIIAGAMVLGMAACGTKQEQTSGEGTTAEEQSASDTFKIGAFLQLTGANSISGNEAKNTLDIAVDYINEQGGLNGTQIETIVYDSQGAPEEAVKIATKLVTEDNVDMVIGSINSSEILAAGKIINDAGVFMMGLGTAETWMKEDWPYVFRATINNANLSANTADMVAEAGFTNVAVVNGQDDASLSTADAFVKYCEEREIEVLTRETYAASDSDFSAQVAKIVAADPQCVYMANSGQHIAQFVKQLRQGGYNGILFSKELILMSDVAVAGEDNSKYIAASFPYLIYKDIEDCQNEDIKAVLQRYVDKYDELPVSEGVYRVWDTMMVVWEASKIAGSNESDALRDAMPQVKVEGLGGPLSYDDGTREGYHSSNDWIYLGDGQYKDYTAWLEEDYDAYKAETGREY